MGDDVAGDAADQAFAQTATTIPPHHQEIGIALGRGGKQSLADANLRQVGLREVVDLQCGDATEVVARLPGPFDGVFFDADRFSAPAQLAVLLPKLATDVLLLADNVLSHADEIAGYLQALEALPHFDRVTIPIGKGLSVAYRFAGNAGPLHVPGQ